MGYLLRRLSEKYESLFLICLVSVAFVLRLMGIIFYIDVPGDGPTRAIIAYNWFQSPYFSTHGAWPPGFMYLAGIFHFLVGDPVVSTRILNLILGTLTVPFFYLLVRKVYGPSAAVFSALILVILPLHVALSATSLTEASFLFEMIAGMVFLIIASERIKGQMLYLSLSLLCIYLALMTRYEAWPLIPLFPSYYFWKTRKAPIAILILLILLSFPATWILGNYLHTGDLFYGFSAAKIGAEAVGAQVVDLVSAIKIIGRKTITHLGWIISIAVACGVILQLIQAIKGKIDMERTLFTLVIFIFWSVMLYFAMVRGSSLFDRYLLFGIVMALPFAAFPFISHFNAYRQWLGVVTLVAIASLGVSMFSHRTFMYVTQKQPSEIKKIAAWLQDSSYSDDPVLLTKMGWQSTYLPLYLPEVASRYLIVSFWVEDSTVKEFLRDQKPSILITREGDEEFQSRIEALLGREISIEELVYKEGSINVFVLKPYLSTKVLL